MDPITAINMEFTREVERSWSDEVTQASEDRQTIRVTPAMMQQLRRLLTTLRTVTGRSVYTTSHTDTLGS